MRIRSQSGFSLIELMVVVAIIGILASIAIPNFKKFQMKAKTSEAKTQLSALYTAEKAFFAEYTDYTSRLDSIGYSPDGTTRYGVGFAADHRAPVASAPPGTATCFATCTAASTEAVCSTAPAYSCDVEALLPTGTAVTATTFTAEAISHLDTAAAAGVDDRWTIDQAKLLSNVEIGY